MILAGEGLAGNVLNAQWESAGRSRLGMVTELAGRSQNLMRLACWLAAGQGLCERDLGVCSRGGNRRARLYRILLSCSSNDDFQAADPFYFRSRNVHEPYIQGLLEWFGCCSALALTLRSERLTRVLHRNSSCLGGSNPY